jgi:hypothetical protein
LTVLSTSAEELVVDLGTATWSVRAEAGELVLRVEADDVGELEQQSARVAQRVEQIARRDGLQVSWQPV